MTFGRFQPPTTGHKENFDNVKRAAGTDDYRIYISQTVDTKGNNPLLPDRKLMYMNKMFPLHKGKTGCATNDATLLRPLSFGCVMRRRQDNGTRPSHGLRFGLENSRHPAVAAWPAFRSAPANFPAI